MLLHGGMSQNKFGSIEAVFCSDFDKTNKTRYIMYVFPHMQRPTPINQIRSIFYFMSVQIGVILDHKNIILIYPQD